MVDKRKLCNKCTNYMVYPGQIDGPTAYCMIYDLKLTTDIDVYHAVSAYYTKKLKPWAEGEKNCPCFNPRS